MPFSIPNISFEQFTLDNGLKVLVHEDHKAPIVAVNVWYHVGSKNEKPGKTGFAHLFEHLMFGGSENFPGSYVEALERVGATGLNGTTNEDRTNYFENVPVPALDYALFAESDRMGHFYGTISQEVLDRQRGVVQNEKRQGDNQPYAIVEDLVVRSTYPAGHPYAHTVIGSMEDLDSASVADVQEWFKTYYTPSNAVLVLAGDVKPDAALKRIERFFGDIPSGPPVSHHRSWIAKMSGEHRELVQDRVPQSRIYKVWNVPGYGTEAADYLRSVALMLTSGKHSRLYKRLIYDGQIATQVAAYLDEREVGSQFVITATARPGQDLRPVEQAIDEELARFLDEGPTPHELDRVKIHSYTGFVRGIERIGGSGGKSDLLASGQTYNGNPAIYRQRLERLEQSTSAGLRDAACAWLSDGLYALEVIPFSAKAPGHSTVDRSRLPQFESIGEIQVPALQEDRLSNGLRILLAERHEIPLVNFWLEVNAGYSADRDGATGASRLAVSLLSGGTTRRTALEISDEVQMLGAQIGGGSNLDVSTFSLSTLTSTLDAALDLYTDLALNPVFPESDFERQRQLQMATIANERVTPLQMAFRVLTPLLYGESHAYNIPLTGTGTEATVAALTREDMIAFHSTWFRPNNSTLIVVGDTTLAAIKPKLESLFGAWKPAPVPLKNLTRIPKPGKPAIYILDKPGASHSVVVAASLAPPPDPSSEIALEMTNTIFGGTFGARLNMNLREDKHWSYGASSVLYGARAQRPYFAYASVQSDKTAETVVEIRKEILGMGGLKPVHSEELEKAQTQLTLEFPGTLETLNSIGALIGDLLQFDLPLDFYADYVARVSALRIADVEACAKALLNPQDMIWIVVADRSEVEPSLRELDLGAVIRLEIN